jgi:hypothetical protein
VYPCLNFQTSALKRQSAVGIIYKKRAVLGGFLSINTYRARETSATVDVSKQPGSAHGPCEVARLIASFPFQVSLVSPEFSVIAFAI